MTEWIPCKEKAPKHPCIACDKKGQIFIPIGVVAIQMSERTEPKYFEGIDYNFNVDEFLKGMEIIMHGTKGPIKVNILPKEIIAWMPMPEPYKEVDNA